LKTTKKLTKHELQIFDLRKEAYWDDAVYAMRQLYGGRDDFDQVMGQCLEAVCNAYQVRSADLKQLDLERMVQPDWYLSQEMIGYICYTDRFSGTLSNLPEHISYLKELGVTYLHLMPLLQPRPAPNDGGYAVIDYRQVDERLGAIEDLANVARDLRQNGISLCTDLVCNHSADDHEWAMLAKAGDEKYKDYYLTFPDRKKPDQYEKTLREIFPESDPGNFLFDEGLGRWVWSTFNSYQWDLNYANPAVFIEMLDIILNLANHGVEIIRMDAVAFMWKEMGTSCENLPQAHAILQALKAFTKMAAPAVIFKAEAIVAPDDVVPYLGTGKMAGKECEIAYHNTLMVYLWSMLAEQNVALATYSLQQLPVIPESAGWVTYARCHDDIGWAIMDEYAAAVGRSGYHHRAFLSDFYSGEFSGTWARGDVFQFNPENGDKRICGSAASLAGLESAYESGFQRQVDLAVKRILLVHNIIFAAGGIPLIYMGDELGMLNDYSYKNDLEKAGDSRWLHRPQMDWGLANQRHNNSTPVGQIFNGLRNLVLTRQKTVALHSQAKSSAVWTHNDHVFGLIRSSARGRLLVLTNFSVDSQSIPAHRLSEWGFVGDLMDQLTGRNYHSSVDVQLEAYEAVWLMEKMEK
jgi:amylosucrase